MNNSFSRCSSRPFDHPCRRNAPPSGRGDFLKRIEVEAFPLVDAPAGLVRVTSGHRPDLRRGVRKATSRSDAARRTAASLGQLSQHVPKTPPREHLILPHINFNVGREWGRKNGRKRKRAHGFTRKPLISWCRGRELNSRHGDFQSPALPTELPRLEEECVYRDSPDLATPFSQSTLRIISETSGSRVSRERAEMGMPSG